jgi:hypothetical protein
LALFERVDVPVDVLAKQLPSLAKNLPAERLDRLAALGRTKLAGDLDAQAATAQSLLEALAQRGAAPGDALRAWGSGLAEQLLLTSDKQTGWTFTALDGSSTGKNPWTFQERPVAEGGKAQLMSSHPLGEQLTGILRSAPFVAPEKLRFDLAGHDGNPGQPLGKKNFVRLRDAETNAVLREISPPRNDTAQRVEWDLAGLKGKRVSVEVVDGDTAPAYAWLAIGQFKPRLPELILTDPAAASRRHVLAAQLAATLHLTKLVPQLTTLFADIKADAETRLATARALLACDADPAPLVAAIADAASPVALRSNWPLRSAKSRMQLHSSYQHSKRTVPRPESDRAGAGWEPERLQHIARRRRFRAGLRHPSAGPLTYRSDSRGRRCRSGRAPAETHRQPATRK